PPPVLAPTPIPAPPKAAAGKPDTGRTEGAAPAKAIVTVPEPSVTAEPSKSQLAPATIPAAAPPVEAKAETAKPIELAAAAAPPEIAKAAKPASNGQSSLIRALGLKLN